MPAGCALLSLQCKNDTLPSRADMAFLASIKLAAFQSSLACAAYVSRQVQLGSEEYFLPPSPAWSFANWSSDAVESNEEFVPLTVVELNRRASSRDVAEVFRRYESDDDVWTPSFTEGKKSTAWYQRHRPTEYSPIRGANKGRPGRRTSRWLGRGSRSSVQRLERDIRQPWAYRKHHCGHRPLLRSYLHRACVRGV